MDKCSCKKIDVPLFDDDDEESEHFKEELKAEMENSPEKEFGHVDYV